MKTEFDAYLRYEELTLTLRALAEEYPHLCSVRSIGKSYGGRDIWLVELTNSRTGPASVKPAFWVDGNTHAGEVTGSMAALYLIEHLLESYGSEDLPTRLLDEQAFYVLPRLSPDGAERYLTTPHTLRATPRPWPEPDEEPGLQPNDVDGDGNIVQMRVADENGEWRVSDGDARLLVPRAPDEADPDATYYRLYREGTFKDFDGFERKIAPPLYGLDMNRQYPYHWQDEERDAGPYPLSEPESRAQVDFVLDHTNIFGVHTYHTYCGAILRPYSNRPDDEMREHDLAIYKALGDRGTQITGYPNISVYHDFAYDKKKFITGAFDDWAYDYYGVFAFTIEFWSMARASGVRVDDFIEFARQPPEEAALKMLAWNDRELNGDGFVPWKPFDHPQLGRVEVGGWKTKFTFQNPPPRFLKAECEKLARFALSHASTAPRLKTSLESEQLSGGLRRIELVVENTGYLPTNVTSVAIDKKLAKPVVATIGLPPDASLVSGEREVDLGHLAGRSALTANRWKNPPFFQGLPSDYASRTTWIVRGDGPIEIEVSGGRAGTVRLETG